MTAIQAAHNTKLRNPADLIEFGGILTPKNICKGATTMSTNKIPLSVRLSRISTGYPPDPAYVESCIRSMADMPISEYMSSFPREYERLQELLDVPPDTTYKQVAYTLYQIYNNVENNGAAIEAARLLAVPFLICYAEERGKYHGTHSA